MKKHYLRIISLLLIISLFVVILFPASITKANSDNTKYETLSTYGFTGDIIDYASNDRDYEWYIDQGDTGLYSMVNCAPAVTVMAIKWADEESDITVLDARDKYFPNGEMWHQGTIMQYLFDNGVFLSLYDYEYDKEQIKEIIDKGYIIILAVNCFYISQADYLDVIGKFYSGSDGHSIIVKGYVETTSDFYLEVYDPASLGEITKGGILAGKLRYYSFEDINLAVKNKWEYMIVVQGK